MKSQGDMILGLRLREVRRKKGLTQREVADMASIPYESYSGYERGESRAPFTRVYNVAIALGVSLDYLAGLSREPAPRQPTGSPGPSPGPSLGPSSTTPEQQT